MRQIWTDEQCVEWFNKGRRMNLSGRDEVLQAINQLITNKKSNDLRRQNN